MRIKLIGENYEKFWKEIIGKIKSIIGSGLALCLMLLATHSGADPGFWEGGSEHRGGSLKQGVWGAQPPRSYWVFPFYSTKIMPKCKI